MKLWKSCWHSNLSEYIQSAWMAVYVYSLGLVGWVRISLSSLGCTYLFWHLRRFFLYVVTDYSGSSQVPTGFKKKKSGSNNFQHFCMNFLAFVCPVQLLRVILFVLSRAFRLSDWVVWPSQGDFNCLYTESSYHTNRNADCIFTNPRMKRKEREVLSVPF
jgi:hypothetical protein